MNEPAGVPSAIGIETVQWLTDEPPGLTVRITGRWRQRRPEWRGPAMLVIESQGRRHRIPAMAEPPHVLEPGTWRMSFAIPSELAEHLEGPLWLALGAVMAPLHLARPGRPTPAAEPEVPASPPESGEDSNLVAEHDPAPVGPKADPELLVARELRSLEAGVQSARRRAREADELAARLAEKIEALQQELARTRAEPDRLRSVIEARERDLRRARQQAHAEAARRAETEEQLAERERVIERLRGRARRSVQREHELQRELRCMRRAVDEARQEAASARVAATRAEAFVPTIQASPVRTQSRHPWRFEAPVMQAEFRLARRRVSVPRAPAAAPVIPLPELGLEQALSADPPRLRGADGPALQNELSTAARELQAVTALLALEREGRQAAERRAEALVHDLERQRERARRALSSVEAFRRELYELRHATRASQGPPETGDLARRPGAGAESTIARPAESPVARPAEPAIARPAESPVARPAEPPAARRDEPTVARPAEMPAVPRPAQPGEPERLEAVFEADRLNAALARLREQHPTDADEPLPHNGPGTALAPPTIPVPNISEPAAVATSMPRPGTDGLARGPDGLARAPDRPVHTATTEALPRLFRRLVRVEPAAAGRLVLALLPAQRLVHPRPVAYDLVLAPDACVQVTVGATAPSIQVATTSRDRREVQFRLEGDPVNVARRLIAGPLRARFGRDIARLHGDRGALSALRALVTTPQSLDALVQAGVRLDPALTLRLVGEQVGSTAPEAFSIAHRSSAEAMPDVVLRATPGQRVTVTEASLDLPVSTTVICPPDALLGVLIGGACEGASIRGETRPLALLRRALQRA